MLNFLAFFSDPGASSWSGDLTILGMVSAAILNAGGLAWWIRSGTDMKMAQRDAAEARQKSEESLTKSTVLESKVNSLDTIVGEIRTRMAKLDRVDEMLTSVRIIEEAVNKHMVPRSEIESQWRNDDARFNRLEREK